MKKRVSVIVEHQTAELSTAPNVRRNLTEIVRQVRELADPGGEVILVCARRMAETLSGVRCLVREGESYYALKNAGMEVASGEIVVFTDADCCLAPGYLKRVLHLFDSRPEVRCVAGRTSYNGASIVARVNTALSFGYLHDPAAESTQPYGVLAHNVAIRAEGAPLHPFGPFRGRVGGDAWLTTWYVQQQAAPRLDRELLVLHEDPSFSVILRMDRQLREVLCTLRDESDLYPWRRGAWIAMGKAFLSPLWRGRKLFRYGKHLGLGPGSILIGVPLLILYGLADVCAVLGMIAFPCLARRWMRYQNA